MKYKYWCIKERHNPQFEQPYYVALGNISMKEIRAYESPAYGFNNVLKFESEAEYKKQMAKLGIEDRR
jgi:hypothetical protein